MGGGGGGVIEGFVAALHTVAPLTLFLYGAGLSLVAFFVHGVWSWHRLRHIPGPALASVSSLWMVRKSLTGKFHLHLRQVAEDYGMIGFFFSFLFSIGYVVNVPIRPHSPPFDLCAGCPVGKIEEEGVKPSKREKRKKGERGRG